jgi:hypothetical protein
MQRIMMAAMVAALLLPNAALAWGLHGHEIIGRAAVAHLPTDLPPFVRDDYSKDEIVYLQSEEDRLKLGGRDTDAWTREWTTDHYVDIADDLTIGGAVSISALPSTRDKYMLALMRATPSVDPYDIGFLPYSILEGYEQVRLDFALIRRLQTKATSPGLSRQMLHDYVIRVKITVHDIGMFSHFVGDGSQPLHVSLHYNGWGKYPNPNNYSQDNTTHAQFESDFVDKFLDAAQVTPLVAPAVTFSGTPLQEIQTYLKATDSQVVPFYELKKKGAFALDDATSDVHRQGLEFTRQRLAAAAQMLDSLIETAWRTSADIKGRED